MKGTTLLFVWVVSSISIIPVSSFIRPQRHLNLYASMAIGSHEKNSRWESNNRNRNGQISKQGYNKPRRKHYNNKANTRRNQEAIQFNRWLSNFLRKERGAVEEAEALLMERIQNKLPGIDYDTVSFNIILSAWSKRRSINAARRADKLMQILLSSSPDLRADSYSYSAVLNAYAKSGGKRTSALRAEELLIQMERSIKVENDFCHNAVMDCWSVSGEADAGFRAQRWLTRLEDRGPSPTRISYNACMKAWARSKQGAEEAYKLLQRMKNLGGDLSPDKISYSTCIDAFCKSTSNLTTAAHRAEALLQEMEQATPDNVNLRPDVIAYTSVLTAYANAGVDYKIAMTLIDRMQKYTKQKPNAMFLNTLVDLFAKTGKLEHAEALLNNMKESDMADKVTYTAVISAHASVGNAKRARELFNELETLYEITGRDDRFVPTAKTFASLLHAISKSKFCSKADLDDVDKLLQKMDQIYARTGSPDLMPNIVVYSQVFLILSNSRAPDAPKRAHELMESMKRKHQEGNPMVRPDATIYAYLINTFTKSGYQNSGRAATKLLDEVERGYRAGDDRLKPTKLLYSAALQAYAKSASVEGAEAAEKLLQRTKDLYREGKVYAKPTSLFYNAVMDAHARSRTGREGALRAEELLKELEAKYRAGDMELVPTTRSYNAAILAWQTSNSTDAPQRAEALLKRMYDRYSAGDKSCRPDRVTFNSIISVWSKCRSENAPERAEKFLRFMEKLYNEVGDKSLKPDSYSFNSVIHSYSFSESDDAAKKADALYRRMKNLYTKGDKELEPCIITLTSLRKVWARRDDEEAAKRVKQLSYMISQCNKR